MKKRIFVLSLMASLLAFSLVASSAMATHQRPVGASPIYVPLVPAFAPCSSPNSTHGAPLNFPSCAQPTPLSSTVKIGAGAVGFAQVLVCNTGAAPALCKESAPGFTTSMQPDVRVYGAGRDIQCAITSVTLGCGAPGDDYNPSNAGGVTDGPYTTICTTAATCGANATAKPFCAPGIGSTATCQAGADIIATAALANAAGTVSPTAQCGTDASCIAFVSHFVGHAIRVTDHYNCAGSGCVADPNTSNRPATMVDILFPIPVMCLPTVSTSLGSACGSNTTANALVPGSVIADKQAVVEVGEVVQLDSGPDGNVQTSDNQLVSAQGIFLP